MAPAAPLTPIDETTEPATDLDADRTSLLVFDAASFPAPPVAAIRMPRRVPNGLHGNWITGS